MGEEKITELTEENYQAMATYRDDAIAMVLATHNAKTFSVKNILELTNKAREVQGLPSADTILCFDSPIHARDEINKDLEPDQHITSQNALYGNQDANWLKYYDYFRTELGLVEETEKLVPLLEIARHIGWFWMSDDTTIITKLPRRISTYTGTHNWQYKGQLETFKGPVIHDENRLAIEYLDGTGAYFLYGLEIPVEYSWAVTTPADELDIAKVLAIKNTEVKSVVLKKIGVERAFEVMDKTKLDEHTYEVGGTYELFSIQVNEQARTYLKMSCPSKQEIHVEGVPNECKTVHSARGWRGEGGVLDDSITLSDGFVFKEPKVQS